MPLCSLFSCVLLNILFLTLTEGEIRIDHVCMCSVQMYYNAVRDNGVSPGLKTSSGAWVTLLLLVVSAPAVLGYLGNRCQATSSEMAVQKKKHFAVQRRDLKTVQMSKQEAMMEVKDM